LHFETLLFQLKTLILIYMLATLGTQHEDKQYKQHNTKCVGHHYT